MSEGEVERDVYEFDLNISLAVIVACDVFVVVMLANPAEANLVGNSDLVSCLKVEEEI